MLSQIRQAYVQLSFLVFLSDFWEESSIPAFPSVVGMQNTQQGTAFTCTKRAPMSADGTIFTSHWLQTAGAMPNMHIVDLIAKVIQLDKRSSTAVTDRNRLIYETQWQALGTRGTHSPTKMTRVVGVHSSSQLAPTLLLTQPGMAAEQYRMHVPLQRAASAVRTAGEMFATCAGQALLLQTAAAHASRGSMLQLISQAAQPVALAPQDGCSSSISQMGVFGMQSMIRVAAQEISTVQWGTADVELAHPQHSSDAHSARTVDDCLALLRQLTNDVGASDMYGRVLSANAWLAPRLLVQEPKSAQVHVDRYATLKL